MLDQFYIAVFNYYKKNFGKRSLKIALLYINILELSIILALGAFFLAFTTQMNLPVLSATKFWWLFSLTGGVVIFKNWMRYNGKKRTVLNIKVKNTHSIYLLWILPIACLFISWILLQAT